MAGRKKKPEEDVKHRVITFVEKKKIDKIGMKGCEELSKEAIDRKYNQIISESSNK